MLRKVKAILLATLALSLILGFRLETRPQEDQAFLEGIRYVNITLTAYVCGVDEVKRPFDVYFPIPPNLENQKVIFLSFSRDPDEILQDEWNQSVARFRISSIEAGEVIPISMACTVKLTSLKYDVDPEEVGSFQEIPSLLRQLYTRDGEMYKINDPTIVSSLNEAVEGEEDPYRVVIRVHDYVVERLSYSLDPFWDDAPTVLRRGEGSCSEYVFAFIALCRAAGIPARFLGGTVLDPSLSGKPLRTEWIDYVFHRWAEVYIPNYGWLPVDVTYDDDDGRDFLFSLTDTYFAFVRSGGGSKYLGWSYLPSLSQDVNGVLVSARALWTPMPEAQEALMFIKEARNLLSQLNVSREEGEEVRILLSKAMEAMNDGNFSLALSLSQEAFCKAKELEKGSRTWISMTAVLALILISLFIVLNKLRS